MGFHRTSCRGLLVSFFIAKISYRYFLPFSAWLIKSRAWKILYLTSVFSSQTGRAKRTSYLYQPYFAFLLCFSLRFSSKTGLDAIWISSGIAVAAFALVQHCVINGEFCTCYFCQFCVVVNQRCHRIASFLRLVLTKISGTLFTIIYAMLYQLLHLRP